MDSKTFTNVAIGVAIGICTTSILNSVKSTRKERDLCYEEAVSVYNSGDYNFKKYSMCKSMGIVKWREYQKQMDEELYRELDNRRWSRSSYSVGWD